MAEFIAEFMARTLTSRVVPSSAPGKGQARNERVPITNFEVLYSPIVWHAAPDVHICD